MSYDKLFDTEEITIEDRKTGKEKTVTIYLPNGLGKKLGETQKNIIKLMQGNPKIAITVLAGELGISTTAIEKHIKTLKEQNIIQRIGGAKGGRWEISSI